MPKIVLGRKPAPLPFSVQVTDVEGVVLTLAGTFNYRTQLEWAGLMDSHLSENVEPKKEDGSEKTVVEIFQDGQLRNAKFLAELLHSWDVEDFALNLENLTKLCNEFPNAVEVLKAKYRQVCVEGKTGN